MGYDVRFRVAEDHEDQRTPFDHHPHGCAECLQPPGVYHRGPDGDIHDVREDYEHIHRGGSAGAAVFAALPFLRDWRTESGADYAVHLEEFVDVRVIAIHEA